MVSGTQGGARYADTSYRLLSPVTFTKIMPLTSPVAHNDQMVENPFRYIELYNPYAGDVCLKGWSLRTWVGIGRAPSPDRTLALDAYTIPVGGTLVVWQRPVQSTLTVADFNARYGTCLVEGKDILVTEQKMIYSVAGGRRIDLFCGNELVSRITYGKFCELENDISMDRPILYGDNMPFSARLCKQTPHEGEEMPLPGEVLPSQLPELRDGSCRNYEATEAERAKTRGKVISRLTSTPLVPFQAAAFLASAVSAFSSVLKDKK